MSLTPKIANLLYIILNRRSYKSFNEGCKHPEKTQEKILRNILKNNRNSKFGIAHNFETIKDSHDFQKNVPLSNYDDYLDPVYHLAQGEEHLLCSDHVRYLALSSGTSAASKLVPYTRRLKSEFNRAINPWIYDLLKSNKGIRGGSQFWIITPSTLPEHLPESVIPIGFESDRKYFGWLRKYLIGSVMCLPDELSMVRSSDNYFYLISGCLLKEGNLRLISVWNPSLLLQIMDYIHTHYESLCRDLSEGTISLPEPDNRNDSILVSFFASRDTRRSLLLNEIGSMSPENVSRIWPQLQLISCWTDAWAGELIPELKKSFPDIRIQGKGLLLTEGVVSIPLTRLRYPVITICSQFYEFRNLKDSQIYLAHELVRNEEYEVIITGSGGFYRYRTDDIVRVKSFYKNTPMIEFLGKKDLVSDLCGEKLHEDFVTHILQDLMYRYLPGKRYMFLAPARKGKQWHYTFHLEIHEEEMHPDEQSLCRELDEGLKQNFHYKHCRRMKQLGSPQIRFLNKENSAKSQKLRMGKSPSSTKKLSYLETTLLDQEIK